jgi:hypothetical protein
MSFAEVFETHLRNSEVGLAFQDPRDYATHLWQVAVDVARHYPKVELTDYVEKVLQDTLRWFKPQKGQFGPLFARELRRRLNKERKDAAKDAKKEADAVNESEARRCSEAGAGERWCKYLFEMALARMDSQTRTHIRLTLEGVPVKDIAIVLGKSEKTLRNRYGSPAKLAQLVKKRVVELVIELSNEQRRLLFSHLVEVAGMSLAQVSDLLSMAVSEAEVGEANILEEEELLTTLGWTEEARRESWNTLEKFDRDTAELQDCGLSKKTKAA